MKRKTGGTNMSSTDRKAQKSLERLTGALSKLPSPADTIRGPEAGPGDGTWAHRPDSAHTTAGSYFLTRITTTMEPEDFTIPALSQEGSLEDTLKQQWDHDPALAGLAGQVAGLAERLRTTEQAQTEEVSPFIYVMF